MKAQMEYNLHEWQRWVPTGLLNATTSALCSVQTDITLNEPEYKVIGKHPFCGFNSFVTSEQHKPDSYGKRNIQDRNSHNKTVWWSIRNSSVYIRVSTLGELRLKVSWINWFSSYVDVDTSSFSCPKIALFFASINWWEVPMKGSSIWSGSFVVGLLAVFLYFLHSQTFQNASFTEYIPAF